MSLPPTFSPTKSDIYSLSTSKQVLVTQDPVFVRRDILNGCYIGRKPQDYMLLSLLITVLNPICGPAALVFSILSDRAYKRGDVRYAQKWGDYAFTACIMTFIFSVILYIAIGFTLSPIGVRGGHLY